MVTSLSATLLITVTAVFTSRTLLLALTMAPLPIAVALVRFPADTSAWNPIAVSKLRTVLLPSAAIPLAVLAMPVLLLKSAFVPRLVLVCAAATSASK